MEAAGIELTPHSPGKSASGGSSGAENGAPGDKTAPLDPDLGAVVAAWPNLPAAIKAGILAMIRAAH